MASYDQSSEITLINRYERMRSAMERERSSFRAHWEELGRYVAPRRPRFFTSDRNRGDRRNQHIVDSTPLFAARTLQSGMVSGLTSPARPWFRLTTHDPSLAEHKPVKNWLHQVTQRMQTVFLRSNVYNALPLVYLDMATFGTAAMGVFGDSEDLMRCYSYPIGSFSLGLDHRGIVGSFVREFELSVEQVVQTFGGEDGQPLLPREQPDMDRFSLYVRNAWEKADYMTPVTITWIVTRNNEYEGGTLDYRQWPFASCYYERASAERGSRDGDIGDQRILRRGGFKTFPVLAPRWDVTGEDTYGTGCPGMDALGDIKALQIMQKRKAQAIEKMVNPPLQAPSELRNQKVSSIPGDATYVNVLTSQQGIRPLYDVRFPVDHVTMDIREHQARIDRAFYADLWLMLAVSDARRGAQPVTAREVEERHEEKLLALGPVLERTNDELLDPLIDRAYDILDEAGAIPTPPEAIQGTNLGVEYISIMAQAQKLVGIVGADRFLNTVGGMTSIWPEARHKVKIFHMLNAYADQLGIDPESVRPDDEAEQMLQAEREAAQQQQQAEVAAQQAKAVRDVGTTPMDETSTLRQLVEGVTQ